MMLHSNIIYSRLARTVFRARENLDDAVLDRTVAEGRKMTLEETIEYALTEG